MHIKPIKLNRQIKMARNRMLKYQIWGDKHFNQLSVYARLFFIGIISNADDDGYIEAELAQLKRMIFGFDGETNAAEILSAYEELKAFKGLHFFQKDGDVFAHLIKWEEHQTQREDRRQPSGIPKCPICHPKDNQATALRRTGDGQATAEVKLSKVSKDKRSKGKQVATQSVAVEAGKPLNEVNEIFRLFYETINPTINFGNKTSRAAVEFLLKKHGFEDTAKLVKYAISIQGAKYAPTITTPHQLKEKYAQLGIYMKKQKEVEPKNIRL